MQRLLLTLIIHFIAVNSIFSQQYPITSNFYSNPFFYNPAMICENEQSEINLFYRKQWVGFHDAPTTQGFNVQFMLPKDLYLGINFFHDKSVLLRSSSLEAGVGYKVKFTEYSELKFGISAGIGTNNFEFDALEDYIDPAIYAALSTRHFLSGRFGISYQLGNLSLGASLPQIFSINYLDTLESRLLRMQQFANYILSAKYQINFTGSHTSIEPLILYRKNGMTPGYFEFGGVLGYKKILHFGTFYKTNIGISALVGLTLDEKVNFSYTYDIATGKYVNYGNGNHELNLRFRFAKPNKQNNTSNTRTPKKTLEIIKSTSLKKSYKTEDIGTIETGNKEDIEQVFEQPTHVFPGKISDEELNPNATYMHYVVIGAFKYQINANRMSNRFKDHDLNPAIKYINSGGLHYVYLDKSKNLDKMKKLLEQVKRTYHIEDIWIYHEELR